MSQPGSLAEAIWVVRQLESARKASKTSLHGGKHKSLNAVASSSANEKIRGEIRELKELVLGINKKVEELEKKTAEKASTVYRKGPVTCYARRQRGNFARNCPAQPATVQSQLSGNGSRGLQGANQTPHRR